jgi:hypothetical protein
MFAAQSTRNEYHLGVNLMGLLFLSLLIGCGQSNPSKQKAAKGDIPEDSETISSCQLLTENEWASVLGEVKYGPDETNRGNNFSMCSVSGENGSVLLMIRHPEKANYTTSQELAEKLTKSAREDPEMVEIEATDYQVLTDLEIPAAYVEIGGIQVWLECYKNDTYLRVQAPNLEKAKAIANLALTKL